jgi:hypothetical protein
MEMLLEWPDKNAYGGEQHQSAQGIVLGEEAQLLTLAMYAASSLDLAHVY